MRDINFATGQLLFNYTSISARDPNRAPGGMNMVLRGVNEAGEPVQNVFIVTYTNSCDVAALTRGESIGRVTLMSAPLRETLSFSGSQAVFRGRATFAG